MPKLLRALKFDWYTAKLELQLLVVKADSLAATVDALAVSMRMHEAVPAGLIGANVLD